jgi:outer membrane protein TolC
MTREVTRAYLDMRVLQSELSVLRKNIDVARSGFDLANTQRGLTNEMDVALAQQHLATLRAGVSPIEAQIAASQHGLKLAEEIQFPASVEA